jgi:hypothetical protein
MPTTMGTTMTTIMAMATITISANLRSERGARRSARG